MPRTTPDYNWGIPCSIWFLVTISIAFASVITGLVMKMSAGAPPWSNYLIMVGFPVFLGLALFVVVRFMFAWQRNLTWMAEGLRNVAAQMREEAANKTK